VALELSFELCKVGSGFSELGSEFSDLCLLTKNLNLEFSDDGSIGWAWIAKLVATPVFGAGFSSFSWSTASHCAANFGCARLNECIVKASEHYCHWG